MMKKILIFVTTMAVGFTSCKDNNTLPNPIDEIIKYIGTQSPGDVWSWELNKTTSVMTASWDHGTFDDTSDDITVTGDFEVLPSGFLKVVITDATPATAEVPIDGTAFFYALEMPGLAMVVKPEGSIKGDIISMVATGDCADVPGDYHYFFTAPKNGQLYDAYMEEAFGHATFTTLGDLYAITGTKSSLDCLDGVTCTVTGAIEGIPSATCGTNGFISIADGTGVTTSEGQFTEAGIFMLDNGKGNGGVFGLKADASVVASDFNSISYNGIAYLPANQNDQTVAVKVDFNDLGVGVGYGYTDIETGTVDSQGSVSIAVEAIDNGFLKGTVAFTSDTRSFAGSLLKHNGSSILVLISTTDDVGNPPFILILTSM